MANNDWENERLFVMESLKTYKAGIEKLQGTLAEFQIDVAKQLAVIQTKLGFYAIIGSAVVSVIVSVVSHYVKG